MTRPVPRYHDARVPRYTSYPTAPHFHDGIGEADYRGERFKDHGKDLKGNNELLLFTRPDVIREIHEQYRVRIAFGIRRSQE